MRAMRWIICSQKIRLPSWQTIQFPDCGRKSGVHYVRRVINDFSITAERTTNVFVINFGWQVSEFIGFGLVSCVPILPTVSRARLPNVETAFFNPDNRPLTGLHNEGLPKEGEGLP
jgi:hypothetical protein